MLGFEEEPHYLETGLKVVIFPFLIPAIAIGFVVNKLQHLIEKAHHKHEKHKEKQLLAHKHSIFYHKKHHSDTSGQADYSPTFRK
jgi:hypothetical protein